MNEMYEEKIRAIADEIERIRLEMYPKISDTDEDKEYFSDRLFSMQSQLRELSTTAGLLDYKN